MRDLNGLLEAFASLVDQYYAIFLAAGGNTERAKEYLKFASAAKLLWEEKELVRKAANSLK